MKNKIGSLRHDHIHVLVSSDCALDALYSPHCQAMSFSSPIVGGGVFLPALRCTSNAALGITESSRMDTPASTDQTLRHLSRLFSRIPSGRGQPIAVQTF